jgi:hypothetical protein
MVNSNCSRLADDKSRHSSRLDAIRAESTYGIAKARQWTDDIMAGDVQSPEEIADQENLAERYVRRLAVLAFLPEVIGAIVDETAPADLTLTSLAQALPHSWAAQEQMSDVH